MTPIRKLLMMKAVAGGSSFIEYTATGNPLSFNTNLAKPLKSLLIPWTPTQSGTGDPSPTNIRPITGVGVLNVWHTGKNLLNISEHESGYIGSNGKISSDATNASFGFILLKSGTNYVVSTNVTVSNIGICLYETDKTTVISRTNNNNKSSVKIASSNADRYVRVWINYNGLTKVGEATDSQIEELFAPQVEVGETATTYTPYSGQTIPVVFPALGKNLFDKDGMTRVDYYTYGNDGTRQSSSGSGYFDEYISVQPSMSYVVSGGIRVAPYYYNADKEWISRIDASDAPLTFTTPENCYFIRLQYRISDLNVNTVQLEQGTSATTYEPYTNTVYGGSLDLTTGVLTVGRKSVTLDGDTEWYVSGTSKFYTHLDDPLFYIATEYDSVQQYGNMWQWQKTQSTGSADVTVNKRFYLQRVAPEVGVAAWNRVWVYDTDYTLTTFKELLNETPLQVTYSIEPYTVQLTPTQITALLGDNVIWTDTNGSNTAVYLKKG